MMLAQEDGTYLCGLVDVICVVKLPTGRYHAMVLEERPMPGPIRPIDELDFIRLQSTMHHTQGADTFEGAQRHVVELRERLKLRDENVVVDVAFEISNPFCVFVVSNWVREKIPLKNALGLQTV